MSNQDTLSPLLALLLMGDGLHNDDWGDQTNNNLTALEQAIAGVGVITQLGGGVTALSAAQALPAVLVFSGTLTANQVIVVPAVTKKWTLDNQTTGNYLLSVTTANGTGINVPQGSNVEAYCDGTNVKSLTIQGSPIGEVTEFYGVELPDARYVWANGQLLNRVSYNALFNALTRTTTVTLGGGATQVAASEDLTGKGLIGATVEGAGVAGGTTITAITSTTITFSAATTGAAGSQSVITILPYGNGDGATTFAVPDRRERVAVGSSVMGGTASPGRISTASMANGANLGQGAGEDRHTLVVAEMPQHTHTVTDPGHVHSITDPAHAHQYTQTQNQSVSIQNGGGLANSGITTNTTQTATTGITIKSATTGITIANQGGNGAHNNLQPLLVCNFILRVA